MVSAGTFYNSEEYRKALAKANIEFLTLGENFTIIKRTIVLPIFGKKSILEARGTPTDEEAKLFKEMSKKFFYGTISSNVLKPSTEFLDGNYYVTKNYTILLDLSKSVDDLWKGLEKKSSRWGVKTAEKNGLTFDLTSSQNELNSFYKIYLKTSKDGGFSPEKIEFIESLINSRKASLGLVKKGKSIVAGGLIFLDSDKRYAILDLTAASSKGAKLQAMPFLYWNLILHAKKTGMNFFDLGGYDKEAGKNEKTYAINRFKDRFGGAIIVQPIYSTNLAYPFLRFILSKARFLKELYRKD